MKKYYKEDGMGACIQAMMLSREGDQDEEELLVDDYSDYEVDEEEDDAISCKDLPPVGYVHEHDIMSCTFDLKNMLIFTGGVDGTIIGWTYETKFARYYMH